MRSRALETTSLEIGRGLLAGLAGTAALTLGMTLESKLRHEPQSTAAGDAAGKVLGVSPTQQRGRTIFSTLVHWAYGAGWGLVRSGLGSLGLRGWRAPVALLGGLIGAQAVMLPGLRVAPSLHRWPLARIATDILQHSIYVAAAELVFKAAQPHRHVLSWEALGASK